MAESADSNLRDEDRLPWLETVEPDEPDEPAVGRVVAMVLLGLAVLAAIIFVVWRVQQHPPADGGGQLIAAQEGDYKVRPDEPGGLQVKGEGDSAIATSAGTSGNASVDLKAVPERPVASHAATPVKQPAGDSHAVAAVPPSGGKLKAAPPLTAAKPPVAGASSGGALVQLGAYPTESAANGAWSALAKRFTYVATLGKSIEQASVNGRSVYRLRVNAGSATAATDLCGRLKVAGESCFVTS